MQLTEDEILAGQSKPGGWKRAQLAKWGVPWPPPAGWKKALIEGLDMPRHKTQPPRLDLALGACRVAANAPDLMTAQAFAQTAIDFLTGDYEPLDTENLPPANTPDKVEL